MPDISRLVIEVDSKGVVTATGNMAAFEAMSKKVGKGADDLGKKFGAFQLIVNKLPGPLQSVAAGLMGMMTPATAAISALIQLGEAAHKFVKEAIAAFAKYEQIRTSIEIVSSSAEQAARTFNDLKQFAITTPFKIEQLSETATMLRQAGISASELIPTLEMLGNISRGSSDNFARIALNFAQTAQTGKATAMDMRQFMLAGVPIQKMLEDIGKGGSTAYEDIAEAIRVATSEGGQFAGAMEKGAQTISGMAQQIENLKEQNKALWAEYSNASGAKAFFNQITYGVEYAKNTVMSAELELREINDRIKNGAATAFDEYRKAEIILQSVAVLRQTGTGGLGGNLERIAYGYLAQANAMYEVYTRLKPVIELQEQLNRQQEEFVNLIEKSNSTYISLQGKIEEDFAKTIEGQRRAIQEQIQFYREALNQTRTIGLDMSGNITSEVGRIASTYEVGITDEERRRIQLIINMLENNLTKAVRTSRAELNSWQKIFKSAMNLSDDDTSQNWFRRQSTAINQFVRMMSTANERALVLADTIGTDITESLESAASMWEDLATQMIMSGEWESNNNLFQQVVQKAREAREVLGEANLDNLLNDIEEEYRLLNMTTSEMERQRLFSEYRVTNEEKITESIERQARIRAREGMNNAVSNASGVSVESLRGLNIEAMMAEITRQMFQGFVNTVMLDNNLKRMGVMSGDEFNSNRISSIEREEEIWRDMYSMTFTQEFRDMANTLGITAREFVEFQNMITQKLRETSENAIELRGTILIRELTGELERAGMSTYELAVRRYMLEKNVTEEIAQQAVEVQKQIDYITNGYDLMSLVMERMDDALRSIRSGEGGYGEYTGNAVAKSAIESVKGTDVGNFAEGTAMGGPLVGLINMLIGAITNVLNSIDGIDEILNPVTAMLMELKDVFKALLLPVLITARLLVLLAKGINWLLNIITFGLIDQMARAYDSLTATNDERDREEERLRALNDQYQKLYEALKLQEEYYLQQRRTLNAEWAIENFQNPRQVNDMILSPHGSFSTDPQDYIIATKHPERLMGGNSAPVFITVNNNAGANISTEESTDADGARLIQITVNSVVRQGFLNGDYDNILDAVSHRRAGKRVVHV